MARYASALFLAIFVAFVYTSVECAVVVPGVSIQDATVQLVGSKPSKECMPVGGRCHSSADCCSKRCLTYSAKCVG
ncbi:unnamed protein product [Hermetia illucens]|uniref:Uncharacterized protein n=1 Tax=Hermetia illucens TaxID=343691 RepID=A0A7R8UZF8_HERIL|nr:uncharacterized protein LOC119657607 [Hermetia illucens]CAD7089989.1 unnamed protein product [Hermetia illucens]